jgi:repressor LexA
MPSPNRDTVHLWKLRDYYAMHRIVPSYEGIRRALGFKSRTSAVKLAKRLIEAGQLQQGPGGRLATTSKFYEIPVVKNNAIATSADRQTAKTDDVAIGLEQLLVDKPSDTVLVRVTGDVGYEAGIRDGDYAVVEKKGLAGGGDFLVAVVDGVFTLKELAPHKVGSVSKEHRKDSYRVQATEGLEVLGVVRGIVRKFGRATSANK